MDNDDVETGLEPNLTISELRAPVRFVTAFLISDERLVVVKNREISVFSYLDGGKTPLCSLVTSETVLEACVCPDLTSKTKYALIFYQSGLVEVRDEKLAIMDSTRHTKTLDFSEKPLIAVDTRFNRFFICWDRFSVAQVDYKVGPLSFQLPAAGLARKVAFRSPHPIVSLAASWNSIDMEEIYNICVLCQPENGNVPGIAIWEEMDLIRNKWKPVLKNVDLGSFSQDAFCDAISLVARDNFGFICLMPKTTIFYDAQKAYFSQKPRWDSFEANWRSILEIKNPDSRFFPALQQSMEQEPIIFGCTSDGEFLDMKLTQPIRTLTYSLQSTLNLGQGNLDTVDKCIHLQGSKFLISTTTMGLVVLDMTGKILSTIPCSNEAVLHSSISGDRGNFMRLLVSGGSSGNSGFLECTFLGCESSPHLKPLTGTIKNPVVDFWLTKHGFYWSDSNGMLHNKDGQLEDKRDVLFVNADGIATFREHGLVLVEPVVFSKPEELVLIKSNGTITWSPNGASLNIPGFANSASASPYVSSAQVRNKVKLTVVCWNSTSVWYFNTDSRLVHLQGLSEACDCLVKVSDIATLVIFIDVFGTVQIYGEDGTLSLQFKISGHNFYLQDLPNSNRFLICCMDCVFLVNIEPSEIAPCEVILPLRLKRMKITSCAQMIALGADSVLYQGDISELLTTSSSIIKRVSRSKSHVFTKHLTLQISRRFVITSALAETYDTRQEKSVYSSELQVYDVVAGKMVQRYRISPMFPQALISDLTAVPYHKAVLWNKYMDTKTTFAKQLVFAKCFLVSLSLEFAEDDLQENLLLFILDDETGEIELQLKTRVDFSITSLLNHSNRIIFAAGESIQALQLEYSAKEGHFSLELISAPLDLDGFAGSCFPFSKAETKPVFHEMQRQNKRQKSNEEPEVLGVHSLVKGIQELEVNAEVVGRLKAGVLSSELEKVTIKHRLVSEYSEASSCISDLRFSSAVKVGFEESEVNTTASCLAAANEKGHVSVMYRTPCSGDKTYVGAQFTGLCAVTGLELVNIKPRSRSGDRLSNVGYKAYAKLRDKFMPLVLVNTSDGGCYLVSTITSKETLNQFIERSVENLVAEHLNCEETHVFGANHELANEAKGCIFG
ncbi:LAME_0E12310g1_1 [Lachancea meyersii CBS 8951]|uniref:LAME_0E12310g1_1 n=1 Tax=Lachancea meyersii CBS 8951 TaxID=1266667 RepID=A0A1G4JM00_9SACH|nr:LAME_0E12310g1_1 [Lachancea meyersii CBS 8951]